MNTLEIIAQIEREIREESSGEGSGHDWYHIDRVRRMALSIAAQEGADTEIVELGALLHDVADWKFHDGDIGAGPREARTRLEKLGAQKKIVDTVVEIVEQVTFKGAGTDTPVNSIEAAAVQDADRLDAMGAIGIGRAFAYGGSRGRLMWNPDEEPETHSDFEAYKKNSQSTLMHFYEKLLLLKDRMQTETGRAMAENRHRFMRKFLEEFKSEWDGES